MEKTPKELYEERNGRISDAIKLRIPDRVPLNLSLGYFPATYTGIAFKNAWYDCDAWLAATKKTVLDFAPDGLSYVQSFSPGDALEHLDLNLVKWPGHGLPDDQRHTYVDGEWMKSDEYGAALDNLSDYMLRVFYPRISGVLEPLRMLPNISSLGYTYNGLLTLAEAVARPEVAEALARLQKAGEEYAAVRTRVLTFNQEIERLGFPITGPVGGGVPFDKIARFLRGTDGTIGDITGQPDTLLAFCEKQLARTMKKIEAMTSGSMNRRVFVPLRHGADDSLTVPQFKKFYWPALKKVIMTFIEQGLTPCPFFEGKWDQRLEYLLELPRGEVLCHFAQTDMKRAKDVLGGYHCIMGGLPSSLLHSGTVEDVKDYCKKLIDDCAGDGGFILTNMQMDKAKPENVRAMVDFTKEYGVYR